ncbi:Lsr2 family DNA-binding protein [Rhodococcus qingshengii]
MKAIREWAGKNGFDVSPRGRIKADVIDAFDAAH